MSSAGSKQQGRKRGEQEHQANAYIEPSPAPFARPEVSNGHHGVNQRQQKREPSSNEVKPSHHENLALPGGKEARRRELAQAVHQ
jgi:hypothetical protein